MTEVGLSDESDIHEEQLDLRTWPGAEVAVPVLTSRVISARASVLVVWKGWCGWEVYLSDRFLSVVWDC